MTGRRVDVFLSESGDAVSHEFRGRRRVGEQRQNLFGGGRKRPLSPECDTHWKLWSPSGERAGVRRNTVTSRFVAPSPRPSPPMATRQESEPNSRGRGGENLRMPFSVAEHFKITPLCLLVIAVACLNGCGDADQQAAQNTAPPVRKAPADLPDPPMTVSELRSLLGCNENAQFKKVGGEIVEAHLFNSGVKGVSGLEGLPLRKLDLGYLPVTDISVVRGMPLKSLILENTQVEDLSPLAGMNLTELLLQNTSVSDISVLEGMPLEKLNLFGTKVTDISVVKNMPLNTLWLRDTKVDSLDALAGQAMESLDVKGTPVSDLNVLAGMTSLRRLDISETQVTDLSPLEGLRLQRLVFTPESIQTGLDIARNMPSLTQVGSTLELAQSGSKADFWANWDKSQSKDQ